MKDTTNGLRRRDEQVYERSASPIVAKNHYLMISYQTYQFFRNDRAKNFQIFSELSPVSNQTYHKLLTESMIRQMHGQRQLKMLSVQLLLRLSASHLLGLTTKIAFD